jgi:hypothetical protein
MRKLGIIAVLSMLVVALTASVAFAQGGDRPHSTQGAHFNSATSSIDTTGADAGDLLVTFSEGGLGVGDITYTVTSDATATYACINGGSNHPKAANKETFSDDVSGGGTFAAKNGQASGTIRVAKLGSGSFSCPSGQTLVLASVSYTNIELTDTNNNVSTDVPDASYTFVNLGK